MRAWPNELAMLGAVLFTAPGAPLCAQDTLPPWRGGLTASLGQPPRVHWHVAGTFGMDFRRDRSLQPVTLGALGLSSGIGNPVTGVLAWSGEVFAGYRGDEADIGGRLLLSSPTLRVLGGVEGNVRDRRLSPLVGFTASVRRGGVFGGGTQLRAEWLPGRGDAIRLSLIAPLGQPTAGRTRARSDRVSLPARASRPIARPDLPEALNEALSHVALAAYRIQDLVVPWIDAPGPDVRVALAPIVGRLRTHPALPGFVPGDDLGTEAVVRAYHAELTRAFSVAVSGRALAPRDSTPPGAAVAAQARRILLDRVLYPFNFLLGQRKDDGVLRVLAVHARGSMARALAETDLSPARQEAALFVFQELLATLDAVRLRALGEWEDSRVLWLPLQFGLLPEEHDTQAELDAILEQALGRRLTDGNTIWYVINEQFQIEAIESIRAARDYHVLWIHDFRGRNRTGEPDALALQYVVDAYLGAMIDAVRRYDRDRRLPVYMIFLDQHYYEVNRGRLWLDFLERPLGALPKLPAGFASLTARLAEAQAELHAAVAASTLLQAEARQYGPTWLRNLLKVHVSVTNPAEASFWSRDIMPVLGVPDNIMRDHRKIAFYDITEEDPWRGLAIYTGMGIGEHYAGATWEDRSIMVQGPAVLTLKEEARQLLLQQGMRPDRVPWHLRPQPVPEAVRRMPPPDHARVHRVLELHNRTGFTDKPINVAKAVLYTLMPPGSVIKVPDSLWGSIFWASLLTGSALRGVRALLVAPSLPSAPSSGWPAMGVAHDIFSRLIVVQQELGPELEAGGGVLKTGIYNPGIGVQDYTSRFGAAYQNARRTPFLRRMYPIHHEVDSLFVQVSQQAPQERQDVAGPASLVVPKLHLKANFFASREAWDSLVSVPEMRDVLLANFSQLERGTGRGARETAQELATAGQMLVEAFQARLSPAQRERVVYYLMVGSANQDYRSMFMDGEATVLLSGWSSVVSLLDFGLIVTLSVWVDDLTLLDALLPPPSALQRRLARMLRPAL